MNVSLTQELERYVNDKVKSGLYHSASEVVRDGLRLMKERDELHRSRLAELRKEVAIGIEQAESGRVQPFTEEATARIKAPGRPTSERDQEPESHEHGGLIIDRGRGPEIAGTRITVYRIMDFLAEEYDADRIAATLRIPAAGVRAAIEYIREHRADLEPKYEEILRDVNQPNRLEIERDLPTTIEELRRYFTERRPGEGAHDRPVRQ